MYATNNGKIESTNVTLALPSINKGDVVDNATLLSVDVTKLYHGVNQAKIKNTSGEYYDLSKPERRRARATVGAELGLEKENTYGVTFRAEYQGYRKSQLNYGVRFNYKF